MKKSTDLLTEYELAEYNNFIFDKYKHLTVSVKNIEPQTEEIVPSISNGYVSTPATTDQEIIKACDNNSIVEIKDVNLGIDLGYGDLKGKIMVIIE